jgi:signal transduction histidine kinase
VTREELLLFTAFDEAPSFLTVVEGPELRIAMINRRVRESGSMVVGKTAREIYPGDNPVIATLERVYATGIRETLHGRPPYYPDGALADRYFTRDFIPLRDEHGNVNRVLVSVHEVTGEIRERNTREESERRSQAELQRLFALLEEAPSLITVLEGPELRIVMMNRRARELFAGRDLIGASFRDHVPPSNATLVAALRVFATGVPETIEVLVRDVESMVGRSFSTTVVPIRDPDGQITRIMTASLEVTEQRRAREALEAQARDLEIARRQAVEASRAKDDFLAMLSHELRNPLAPIVTTLELMRLSGMASMELDVLERQVGHLTRLVDDLLDVSRIARGLLELKRRDLDLTAIAIRALEMTKPLLEQRRQKVITALEPAAVHGDPDRLAHAVANLITNAAKYSEIGSQIRIQTQRSGELAKLSVADDGMGIAPDMIGRVFDAFVQQPQMLARSQGGLGLGLSIVRSLVEAHDGTVSAQSDGPGRGSTFIMQFPAIEGPGDRADVSRPQIRRHPPGQPRRILVVDDNRDAAASVQRGLEALGHIVATAHDGPSALAAAATFKPQVGFLDIGLPSMDGCQLAVALRAAHDIHLVAITGYGQLRDRQRSRDAGFEGHLVKPVTLDQLARLLQQVLVV